MGYVCMLTAFRDIFLVVNLVNKETEFGNICRRSQIYKLSPNQITTLKMYEQAWKLPIPNQAIATAVTLMPEETDPPCKWQVCYILLPSCISLLFQFSSRRYLYARKSPYRHMCSTTLGKAHTDICVPPRLSEFSQCRSWSGSNVRLNDDSSISLVLSRKIVERFLFPRLSSPPPYSCDKL